MKALFVTLAVIVLFMGSTWNQVEASGITEDCNSPLLLKGANPDGAPETSDKLSTPQTFTTLSACKRLQNKKVCCTQSSINAMGTKFAKIKDKFKSRRKEQAQTLTRIENDIDKNEEEDSDMDAKLEAFKNDAFSDSDAQADALQQQEDQQKNAGNQGKIRRLLSEEDTPQKRERLMRLLGSLKFLEKYPMITSNDERKLMKSPFGRRKLGGKDIFTKTDPNPNAPGENPENPGDNGSNGGSSSGSKNDDSSNKSGSGSNDKSNDSSNTPKLDSKEKAEDKDSTNAKGMFSTGKNGITIKTKNMAGAKKFGRSSDDGGRPGAVDDDDRDSSTGKRLSFKQQRAKYKPKQSAEQKSKGTSRPKSTYGATKQAKGKVRTIKNPNDSSKTLKRFDKTLNEFKTKTKEQIKTYKKDYRKQFKAAVKKEYKEKLKTYKDNLKKQKTELIKTQKRCFQAIMKFTAGSLCLACDASYKKQGWLVEKPGSNGKIWQLKLNQNSCTRLKTVCFDYLQERTNVGQWLREAEQQVKKRKEYKLMKSTIEEMESCEDDAEFGCSSKKKDEIIDKASKFQEDNDAAQTDKKKADDMKAKFQGGAKKSDGTKKAPMSVKLPTGCTNKDDCNWICTHMAKASGADFDAVDMKDQESLDGTTKYTESQQGGKRRILEGDDITLENDVVTDGSSAYEPDSTENTEGLDSSFEENVDSSVDDGLNSGRMFTNSWTIGFSLVVVMATILQR